MTDADSDAGLVFQCAGPIRRSRDGRRSHAVFPAVERRAEGVIAPDERLPAPQTLALGLQHVVAMFGATVLAPLLMGFDPNVAILFSGIGTLIFFVVVGGRVPSYLGSSFAFIGRRDRRHRLLRAAGRIRTSASRSAASSPRGVALRADRRCVVMATGTAGSSG